MIANVESRTRVRRQDKKEKKKGKKETKRKKVSKRERITLSTPLHDLEYTAHDEPRLGHLRSLTLAGGPIARDRRENIGIQVHRDPDRVDGAGLHEVETLSLDGILVTPGTFLAEG